MTIDFIKGLNSYEIFPLTSILLDFSWFIAVFRAPQADHFLFYAVVPFQLFKSSYWNIIWCENLTKFVNRYYVDQMANGKGFIVDVKIKICLPIDSEVYCIPQNGFHLLQRQQFPVCAKDFFDWMKGMIIIYHIFCKKL